MKFNSGNFKVNGAPLAYFIGLTAILYACWILLSGKFEAKFLIMGAIFALVTAYICGSFLIVKNIHTGKEFFLLEFRYVKAFKYTFWLLWQIVLASLDVTKATLNKVETVPAIVFFKMDFENPMASATLANSIILTPGTITLDISPEGVFEVHALTKAAAEGIFDGTMQRKVAEIFDETCEFVPMPEATLTEIPKEID